LAAQQGPADAQFAVLTGPAGDGPHEGLLANLAGGLPHPVRVCNWREVGSLFSDLAADLEHRHQRPDERHPSRYVFVDGLQRFRELRRADDDFSFGRRGEEKASPAKQFASLLREGPASGIHFLIWCDTLNNATRSFDRQLLREFEMRVLFQMSAADSSHLIDSPLAGKLGLHRALYATEDAAQPEKFRPYGLPEPAWVEEALGRIRQKWA
jgi:hypothetical protein